MKQIPFILAFFTIFSCRAVPVRYSKGFSEEKSSAGVYTVKFTGNGFSDPASVEKALDRRCAELTLKEGYDWFTYYTKSRNDKVASGTISKAVPSFYGVIHLHKGPVSGEGYDARKIVEEPLPSGIIEN